MRMEPRINANRRDSGSLTQKRQNFRDSTELIPPDSTAEVWSRLNSFPGAFKTDTYDKKTGRNDIYKYRLQGLT
jgi:hypothetical protein